MALSAEPRNLARSTRPSARLAQLTVPSMAPAGIRAAKASYINTMPTTMQAPSLIAAKKDAKLANNWKTKSADELTGMEVAVMPDNEYMNDKQMAFFRPLSSWCSSKTCTTTLVRPLKICVKIRWLCPIQPIVRPSRKSMRSNCARGIANASCSRRSSNRLRVKLPVITAIAANRRAHRVGRLSRTSATLSLEAQQRRELKLKMFGG